MDVVDGMDDVDFLVHQVHWVHNVQPARLALWVNILT